MNITDNLYLYGCMSMTTACMMQYDVPTSLSKFFVKSS